MEPSNEELLRRVLWGEIEESSPEVRQALREDPDFARTLEDARSIVRALDSAGASRAEALADAEAMEASPAERSRLQALVHAHLPLPERNPARRWRGSLLAVAAALLLLLGWWGFHRTPDVRMGIRHDPLLGGVVGAIVGPKGRALGDQGFERFEWTSNATTGWFTIEVQVDGKVGSERSPNLDLDHEWKPAPELWKSWHKIRWTLYWHDATGQPLALDSAEAEL